MRWKKQLLLPEILLERGRCTFSNLVTLKAAKVSSSAIWPIWTTQNKVNICPKRKIVKLWKMPCIAHTTSAQILYLLSRWDEICIDTPTGVSILTASYWCSTKYSQPLNIKSTQSSFWGYSLFILFLSSANEVSTGPTCQFLWFCLFVCVSGLFFKASNWMIYWHLTVVLATYLSE